MKKTMKILSILFLVIMIVLTSSNVFASDLISQLEKETNEATPNMTPIMKPVGTVIATIRNAAVIIGVVILVILGIKYMLGSVEQKADYQKNLIPLVVGIVVVMTATQIAAFLFEIL